MTPGPASRIVRELPRKSPTPIAPPIVIMMSWRCVSLRLSSGELSAGADSGAIESCSEAPGLLIPNNATEHLPELVNLLDGVVMENRCAVDAGVEAATEMLHQPRRVHVSVANADAAFRHGFCNRRRQDIGKGEAKSGNAFGNASRVVDTVDDGARGLQHFENLARERRLVLAYGGHRVNDRGAPRCGLGASFRLGKAIAESLEIGHSRSHPGDIFVDERARLDLAGRCVGDEVLAESLERIQQLEASPHKAHVRSEDLVAGADEVVAIEGLHIH